MDRTIYGFIFRFSKREQVFILLFTVLSLPFYYVSLDIPKLIVNNVLNEIAPELSTGTSDTGGLDVAPRTFHILGYELFDVHRLWLLGLYSGLFLVLVLINGGFKYFINVYKGRLGERMLRRLRYQLYSRVLRFPLPHFRRVSAGEVIPMITQEVEPLGGFIGDALALPMYQGGMLITALVFIFMQDFWMGLASISLYPVQGWLIPKLQRRVNLLGKARVREVRKLSERIAETIHSSEEMHANGMARWELAEFTERMARIFEIRFAIYNKKFFIKFLNSILAQMTPFFFYSIGGYFVITGDLSLGGLVAVLAAYKDLPPPWKELLNHYQIQADAMIKYDQVVTQFAPPGMREEDIVFGTDEEPRFGGHASALNLRYEEDGDTLVEGLSLDVEPGRHVALVGDATSGKAQVAMVLARLLEHTGGTLRYDERDAEKLPEMATGRAIGYVGPVSHLFSAPLLDNLLYGLRQAPVTPRPSAGPLDDRTLRRYLNEAEVTGNSTDDPRADWTDLTVVEAADREALIEAVRHALTVADMENDVYLLGLRGTLDPEQRPERAARLLKARHMLQARLSEPEYRGLVESFDRDAYNLNATIGENLLFGTPVGDAFDLDRLSEDAYVMGVLGKVGLVDDFLKMGHEVAQTMVELFAGLPPDHEYFAQFSFIGLDDLPEYQAILRKVERDGLDKLDKPDRMRLMALPFKLSPARHRLGMIDEVLQGRILEARRAFAENLPADLKGAVEFYDVDRYNAASSLQDNILFGKMVYGRAQAQAKVGELMSQVIEALELRSTVVEVGLDFEVGIGGTRLSPAQRQKASIARAVLKRPQIMILSEATAALDGSAQTTILNNIRAEFRGRSLIWVMHQPSQARGFDRVLVMSSGKLAERGTFEELAERGSTLSELIAAE